MCMALKIIFECDTVCEPEGCRVLCRDGPCATSSELVIEVPFFCAHCHHEIQRKYNERIAVLDQDLAAVRRIPTRVIARENTVRFEIQLLLRRDELVLTRDTISAKNENVRHQLRGTVERHRAFLRINNLVAPDNMPREPDFWAEANVGAHYPTGPDEPSPLSLPPPPPYSPPHSPPPHSPPPHSPPPYSPPRRVSTPPPPPNSVVSDSDSDEPSTRTQLSVMLRTLAAAEPSSRLHIRAMLDALAFVGESTSAQIRAILFTMHPAAPDIRFQIRAMLYVVANSQGVPRVMEGDTEDEDRVQTEDEDEDEDEDVEMADPEDEDEDEDVEMVDRDYEPPDGP